MMSGDFKGLQPSQVRQLEQLYELHLTHHDGLDPEFAYHLAVLTRSIRQPLSCYLNSAGQIVHVALGTPDQTVFPPDFDLTGDAHLRGITTVLHQPDEQIFQAIAQPYLDTLIVLLLQSDDRGKRALETEVPIQHIYWVRPTSQADPAWTVEMLNLDILLNPNN